MNNFLKLIYSIISIFLCINIYAAKPTKNKTPLPDERAIIYLENGTHLYQNDQPIEALDAFSKAIAMDSTFSMAYFYKGIVETELQDYNAASKDFNTANKLDPKDHEVLFYLGIVYTYMDSVPQAIKSYSQAIKLYPKDYKYFHNRGILYHTIEKYEEAYNDYNKAIKLNPLSFSTYMQRGYLLKDIGAYDLAYKDFDLCNQVSDEILDSSIPYKSKYNIAMVYYYADRYSEAITWFDQAIEINPEQPYAYYFRGLSKLELDDNAGACNDFNTALGLGALDAQKYIDECNSIK